jgi:hypothetical protein
VEAVGVVPNRVIEAPRRRASVGEPANGGEARYPLEGVRIGDGVGTKFCVLTRGDLPVSAMER